MRSPATHGWGRRRFQARVRTVPARRGGTYTAPVPVLKTVFWGSLGALAWTHLGYPVAVEIAARLRRDQCARRGAAEPSVAVIVAALQRGAGDRAAAREPPCTRLSRRQARGHRRVRRVHRSNERDRRGRRSTRASRAFDRVPARRQGRRPESRRRRDVVSRLSRSPTGTPRGLRTPFGTSSRTSPTRTSPTSAASSGLRRPPGRIARGRTGATR